MCASLTAANGLLYLLERQRQLYVLPALGLQGVNFDLGQLVASSRPAFSEAGSAIDAATMNTQSERPIPNRDGAPGSCAVTVLSFL